MKYDVLYQEWLSARRAGDYTKSDALRDEFERLHGLTIFAEGTMPIEGITMRRMRASVWHKKYGSPEVGEIIARHDSYVKMFYPDYHGLRAVGYYYDLCYNLTDKRKRRCTTRKNEYATWLS